MAKLGWMLDPSKNPNIKILEYVGKLKGLNNSYKFIPVMETLFAQQFKLLDSYKAARVALHEYNFYSDDDVKMSDETVTWFNNRYKTDAAEVASCNKLLASVTKLPATVSHALIRRMIECDTR